MIIMNRKPTTLAVGVRQQSNLNYKNKKKIHQMNKNRIKLTESQLHEIIKESVKNVLNEIGDTPQGQYMLGRLKQNKLYNHQDGDEAYIGQYAADQRKKSNYDLKKLRDAHQQGFSDQWDKNHKK